MRSARRTLAALTAVAILAACGDTSGPDDGEAQNFSGNYTLVSFSQGTAASVVEIPGTVGSFTMTATTYEVSVTVPVPVGDPIQVDDEGTYTASGTATAGTWTQQSSLDDDLQSSGTYTWNPTTERLTLDTTMSGVRSVLVLQKI